MGTRVHGPDNRESTTPTTPFAQPLHHQLYSAAICSAARSGPRPRSNCAITAWALEWRAGPDIQRLYVAGQNINRTAPTSHRTGSSAFTNTGDNSNRALLGAMGGECSRCSGTRRARRTRDVLIYGAVTLAHGPRSHPKSNVMRTRSPILAGTLASAGTIRTACVGQNHAGIPACWLR